MKKQAWLFALPIALFATPAMAQMDSSVVKPFSVRAGVAWLTQGDAREFARNNGLTLGVGYDLPMKSFLSPETGTPSIELDWQRHEEDGYRLDSFAVYYVERVPFDQMAVAKGSYLYGGVGVGVSFNSGEAGDDGNGGGGGYDDDDDDGGYEGYVGAIGTFDARQDFTPGDSFSRATIGAKFIIGYKINPSFFIEGAYKVGGSIEGLRSDSLSLMVGVKF